jgi:hypothetical protein
MSKYIFTLPEFCQNQYLVPLGEKGPVGPQGPQGPTGPGFTLGNTGFGSVLVVNPQNKEEIYYNESLNVNNERILVGKDLVPSQDLVFSLGVSGARWKDINMGPGTLNIFSPNLGINATLGADNNGIAYTEKGFASPFITVGPKELTPAALGGWKISSSGTQPDPNYDLVAQGQ